MGSKEKSMFLVRDSLEWREFLGGVSYVGFNAGVYYVQRSGVHETQTKELEVQGQEQWLKSLHPVSKDFMNYNIYTGICN